MVDAARARELDYFLGVMAFAVGASVGSFLNVVADRVPAGRSVVRPRSFCEACNRPLTTLDLLPVVSYLWLRGRCRYCGAAFPARLMLMEAATGALFAAVYARYGSGADFFVLCAAVSLLLVIARIDLEHKVILNSLVYPSVVVLVVLAPFWTEMDLPRPFLGSSTMLASLLNSLVAGAGAFLFFLVIALVYPRGMGGGDVKLAAPLGLLVGYPGAVVAIWLAFVTGGLVGAYLLLSGRKGRKDEVPFGPFLSLGAIIVLLVGGDTLAFWT